MVQVLSRTWMPGGVRGGHAASALTVRLYIMAMAELANIYGVSNRKTKWHCHVGFMSR
jgi:hypothetical protein